MVIADATTANDDACLTPANDLLKLCVWVQGHKLSSVTWSKVINYDTFNAYCHIVMYYR